MSIIRALTRAGIGGRRSAADAIRQGRVQVNSELVADFRRVVGEGDIVSVDGRPVPTAPAKPTYLVLNKPPGVLSTTRDQRGRTTVMDLLPRRYAGLALHLVGRLDKDSSGLLLLTSDGDLTHRLTHPRFEHEKEYLVHVEPKLRAFERKRLASGLELEDGITYPASVKEIKAVPFNYSITIHEGRKHQVRRMFEKLGHRVLALKRVRMSSLLLGDLSEGEVRELSAEEVRRLRSACGLSEGA
jgi:23S rRNA pseudouridine2605 synthase